MRTPFIPKPDKEGIREVRKLCRERLGREITEEEAKEILRRLMSHLYALNFPEFYEEVEGDADETFRERHASREPARKRAKKKAPKPITHPHETIAREPGETAGDEGGEALAGRARRTLAPGLFLEPG